MCFEQASLRERGITFEKELILGLPLRKARTERSKAESGEGTTSGGSIQASACEDRRIKGPIN